MSVCLLLLGGTAEARAVAADLATDARLDVVSSLAGRVVRPALPAGRVRIGGFGGPDGLADWLREHRVGAVVDATHPFAAKISASAVQACARQGVPLLRLQRPPWTERPGDVWHRAPTPVDAAALLASLGGRVMLTTGRQGLDVFVHEPALWFLARCVDPPTHPLPANVELLLSRGPYTLDGELALMLGHRIDLLVTKDSGGVLTEAKLDAARRLALPVVVVDRPPRPAAATVERVEDAVAWVRDQLR